MAHQMQKQNESCVWLTELVFGPGHTCANSRSRPGPPDMADLCVPGEPGCARHSRSHALGFLALPSLLSPVTRRTVSRPPQSPLPLELLSPRQQEPGALPPPRAPLSPVSSPSRLESSALCTLGLIVRTPC
jgi:hypothetical protein